MRNLKWRREPNRAILRLRSRVHSSRSRFAFQSCLRACVCVCVCVGQNRGENKSKINKNERPKLARFFLSLLIRVNTTATNGNIYSQAEGNACAVGRPGGRDRRPVRPGFVNFPRRTKRADSEGEKKPPLKPHPRPGSRTKQETPNYL